MLIFDRFPSKQKAQDIAEHIQYKFNRKSILCKSQCDIEQAEWLEDCDLMHESAAFNVTFEEA